MCIDLLKPAKFACLYACAIFKACKVSTLQRRKTVTWDRWALPAHPAPQDGLRHRGCLINTRRKALTWRRSLARQLPCICVTATRQTTEEEKLDAAAATRTVCRVNRDLQGFQVIGVLKQVAPDDVNVVFSHLSETCYIKIVVVLVLYCLQVEEAVVITRNRSRKWNAAVKGGTIDQNLMAATLGKLSKTSICHFNDVISTLLWQVNLLMALHVIPFSPHLFSVFFSTQ